MNYEIKPSAVAKLQKFELNEGFISKAVVGNNKIQKLDLSKIEFINYYEAFQVKELTLKAQKNKITLRAPQQGVEKDFNNKNIFFKEFCSELVTAVYIKNNSVVIRKGNQNLYYMAIIMVLMLAVFLIGLPIKLFISDAFTIKSILPSLFVIPIAFMFLKTSMIKPKTISLDEFKNIL